MRTFIIIWLGQLVSTVGSYMTSFALTLWAWEITGSATALALVGFFSQLPRVFVILFSGVIVDRLNRKHLMILADAIAVLSSVVILILYSIHALQIWHLYLIGAINSSFAQIQQLAYTTSLTLLVPPQQYTRVSSMGSALNYGPAIFAPALAGSLYPTVGLGGILMIDIITFFAAFTTLIVVQVPQPKPKNDRISMNSICQDILFGFQYVFQHSNLRILLFITAAFWFVHDFGEALYDPMILARSNGNAAVLASTSVAAGVGGVTGAVLVSLWGGPKRRIRGLLNGMIGAGISKTFFGLGQSPKVWIPAQCSSSLNFPLLSSSEDALWFANVTAEIQGRVFAASALILQACSAIATLIAGPLADRVFEPVMQSNGWFNGWFAVLFSPIVGTGAGAGIALLYVITSIGLLSVGIGGYRIPQLWALEKTD